MRKQRFAKRKEKDMKKKTGMRVFCAGLAAMLGLAVFVLVPASASAAEKQELVVWHSKATDRGKVWAKLVEDFNNSHPDIKVTATYQGGYETTIQKVTTAIAANATPDVAELPQSYGIPQFAESGRLLPLDGFLTKEDKADFYEPAIARYTYKGKIYAIPNAVSTSLLYYNVDMFKEVGLDPNKPPQTWDELVAAGKKLTRDINGDGKIDKWGLVSHTTVNYFLYAFIAENGGELFDSQGNPVFNSKECVEAFQYWSDLVHKHKIMPPLTHTAANKLFIAGTAGMMYQSTGFMETLDRSVGGRFQYKVAFMPKKKGYGTDIGGTGIGIFKSNPKREAAAWTFVKWMTDTERSAFWSEKTGYIAARKSSHKFPSHVKFLEANPNNRVAAEQLPYAAVQYAAKADGIIYKPIGDLSEKIESSATVDIKKELDQIVAETKAKMKQ